VWGGWGGGVGEERKNALRSEKREPAEAQRSGRVTSKRGGSVIEKEIAKDLALLASTNINPLGCLAVATQ